MNKFCVNCNYVLDITKNIDLKNIDNIDNLIKELLNNNFKIKTSITLNDIIKNKKYNELKDSEKKVLTKNYELFKNLNNIGFFKCNNCGYIKNIDNGTILIDSDKITLHNSELSLKLQSNNNILPRTRDYICPNLDCKAHDKKYSEREAVFFRNKNSYKLNYLCCICNTKWLIS